MQERISGNEFRTTIICIDSYDDRVPIGRFHNPHMSEAMSFHGVMDLLAKVDGLMTEMKFPQSFNEIRTFSKAKEERVGTTSQDVLTGKVGTFAVKIIFRQNASWQGSVTWVEGKAEESFRSVMELLFLIDSACTA